MEILTSRLEGMDFKEYKMKLRLQKKLIKYHKKGTIVWLSKLYPSKGMLKQLEDAKMMDTMGRLLVTGEMFRGKVKDLKR